MRIRGKAAIAGLAACVCIAQLSYAEDGRPGTIQFSNGEVVEGVLSITPGTPIRIYAGKTLKEIPFQSIREIRFNPEKELMEQKWRFVEAGRNEKKRWGEPYPIREITATVYLAGGKTMAGHLYTTVVYVESEGETTKTVIKAKDKGAEGEKLEDVVYPVRIAFSDDAADVPGDVHIEVNGAGRVELVVLAEHSLLRLEARRDKAAGGLVLPSLTASNVFVGVKQGDVLKVGWPKEKDEALDALIEKAMPDVRDFFDARKVLGTWRDGTDVYSLMMLSRKGKTSLHAAKSQPWRLEVWRWKEEGGKVMLAGRGYFFRGILEKGVEPPEAKIEPLLWKMEIKDKMKLP